MRRRGSDRGPELAVACVALVALTGAVVGPHVRDGGLYSDDWSIAASTHFDGYRSTAVDLWREVPARPVMTFLLPVPYRLFGVAPHAELALAAALGVLASLAFFALLRAAGFPRAHALLLSLLTVIFPWSDALRLWPTASMINVALIAYFLGAVLALKALTAPDGERNRPAWLHVGATGLYVVSVLTYEATAAAIVMTALLYRTRVGWRALRRRWLVDVAAVVTPLALLLPRTVQARRVGTLSDAAADVPRFVREGISLFAATFLPSEVASYAGKLVVLAAVAAVVSVAIARRRDLELRTWLWRGAGAVVIVVAGYVVFLGSTLFPLDQGLDSRVNTLAAFGFVLAAYSVVVLAASLVTGRRASAAVLVGGVALLGFVSIQHFRADVAAFDRSRPLQRDELARLDAAVSSPRAGVTLFVFGYPAETAPGIPIFVKPWDLSGAFSLRAGTAAIRALPIYREGVSCSRSGVRPDAFDYEQPAAYGAALFIELPTGAVRAIRSVGECRRARAAFRPGPLFASAGGRSTE